MSKKPTDTQIRALIARWNDVLTQGGAHAYQVAWCAQDTAALYPPDDYESFKGFHINLLDIRFPPTIRMHWNMAKTVRLVQEEAVWRAIGWEGVRELAKVTGQANRKKISKKVLQLASSDKNAKLKPVTRSILQGIIKQIAPDTLVRPRARTEKKPSGDDLHAISAQLAEEQAKATSLSNELAEEQAKTARLSNELAARPTASATAAKATKHSSLDLAATLRRLIYQDGCQFIVNLLTEEERKAVGVSKLREKAS